MNAAECGIILARDRHKENAMSSAQTIPQPPRKYTVEEYLALERAAEERHEYFDGEIVAMDRDDPIAMAGEKLPHGIISLNIGAQFNFQLKGTACFAVTKDTKVRSGLGIVSTRSAKGMFSYPDILVVCGEPEYFDEHSDVIMNPTVIVEVLSQSTESYDRGAKFQRYRAWNPTLKDYVLVSQTQPFIEHFRREPDGAWKMQESVGLEGFVTLSGVPCVLKLADVYDRIVFKKEPAEGEAGAEESEV
jgi:Uma2 family endonuclease